MPIRITGMGSGLDIDKLVSDLMKAEKIPLDKLKQKKTITSWTGDLYREVNSKLSTLRSALDKIRLTGDWKDYKATSSNDSIVSATVNAGVPAGNHKVEVTNLASGASITGSQLTSFDPSAKFGSDGSITFTLGSKDQTINFTKDDTFTTIINKVNSSPAGVRMSYNELTKQMSIVTKETGSGVSLSAADSGGILTALKLTGTGVISSNGSNAQVKIDDVPVSPTGNTFTANGITYKFQDKTTGPVTIRVGGENDGMVKQITEFVDAYNSTIDLLNQRVKEKKNRGYEPLSDDQKSEMKDSDIKNWEDKAKSGLLGNDLVLKSLINGLRAASTNIVSTVPEGMNALFKIGISTMPYNSSSPNDSGKLVVDEVKLRKALSEDAGSIVGLFTDSKNGMAKKMYDSVDGTIKELIEKAGGVGTSHESITNTLGKRIVDINQQIENFKNKLASKEDYYYKMFAGMDSAVGRNNSQLNWLMQNGR